MAKPRHLALCVLPGGALSRGDRVCQRRLAAQVAQEFGQPDGLHRRQIGIEVSGSERLRLSERSRCHHPGETGLAQGIEPVPWGGHQDHGEAI
jgi:hypothetical protein